MSLPPNIARWAQDAIPAALRYQLDPYLLLAVCSRESDGGAALTPPGPSGTGDSGHGRGLMQVDDRWHATWVSTCRWEDPAVNLAKGAEILRSCLDAFAGLPARQRMRAALAAYNAGPGAVRHSLSLGHDPDEPTTGGDYSRDVLARYAAFHAPEGGL